MSSTPTGEEENEIFPQLTRAKVDWGELQQQVMARRQALQQELMPEAQMASPEDRRLRHRAVTEGSDAGDESDQSQIEAWSGTPSAKSGACTALRPGLE